jgi:hypothetical protein
MSKTCEHYHPAARHYERAAYHYKQAAKYDQAEEHEKAAHFAYLLMDTINTQFNRTPRRRNCMPAVRQPDDARFRTRSQEKLRSLRMPSAPLSPDAY